MVRFSGGLSARSRALREREDHALGHAGTNALPAIVSTVEERGGE
jgi:hypothetical protein